VSEAATTSVSPVVLARAVAASVLAVDGVVDLDAGTVGEYATYGAGQRQPGVRAVVGSPPRVAIRLVVAYPVALPGLVDRVREAVVAAVAGLPGAGGDAVVSMWRWWMW